MRHPNITSEVKDDNSEQLKLSEAQSRLNKKEKPVLDGMWDTLVTKSRKEDLNKYFENSAICMNKAVPNIVNKKVLESEKSESNRIRSVRVLYEGGLVSTVNSLYCGHCRDLELVSLLARVRNSGSLFQSNVCNLFLPGI